jgi:hypothetical protein
MTFCIAEIGRQPLRELRFGSSASGAPLPVVEWYGEIGPTQTGRGSEIFPWLFSWLCEIASWFLPGNVLFRIWFELVLRHFNRNGEKRMSASSLLCHIVWSISTWASPVWWECAELWYIYISTYIYIYFIIRRSLHYLHSLLQLAAPKPEIRHSILRDRDHSKSLAETQRNWFWSASWIRSSFSLTLENK